MDNRSLLVSSSLVLVTETRVSPLTIVLQVQEPTTPFIRCQMYRHRYEQKLGEATPLIPGNLLLADHRDTSGNRLAKGMTEYATAGMPGADHSRPLKRITLPTSSGLSLISKFSSIFRAMAKWVSGSTRVASVGLAESHGPTPVSSPYSFSCKRVPKDAEDQLEAASGAASALTRVHAVPHTVGRLCSQLYKYDSPILHRRKFYIY